VKIAFASDHAGFALKARLVDHARRLGYAVDDLGPTTEDRVDYPDYAVRVAAKVASGEAERGVLVCGSGVGVAMTANRFKGVRAVNAVMEVQARLARQHNAANVLCLGQRLTAPELATSIFDAFIDTGFEGGRHAGRVEKMEQYGSE
jgi:ribose 5-phosphate isomerase B